MDADTETTSSYRHASPFGAFFMGHQNLSMTIFISVYQRSSAVSFELFRQ